HYFRRSSVNYGYVLGGNTIPHIDFINRWKSIGDENQTVIPSFQYPNINSRDNFFLNSSALIEKGDHVRIQDLKISYLIGNITLYTYFNNLPIIWAANKQSLDPDFNS